MASSSSSASVSKSSSLASLNDHESANNNHHSKSESEKSSAQPVPANEETEEEFKFSSEPSIEQIRQMQRDFVNERCWNKYHTPRNILLALVGEIGELAEIFQWKGECEVGLPDWSEKEREHLGQEMSDVFIYLTRLADICKIDLPKAIEAKIEHNKQKYPVEKFFGSSKKYNQQS